MGLPFTGEAEDANGNPAVKVASGPGSVQLPLICAASGGAAGAAARHRTRVASDTAQHLQVADVLIRTHQNRPPARGAEAVPTASRVAVLC